MILAAFSLSHVVFDVANALRVPVQIAALIALAVVLVELGALIVERVRRRPRSSAAQKAAARAARTAMAVGEREQAAKDLAAVSSSSSMWEALDELLENTPPGPEAENEIAKTLADFDLRSMRRLERTRMLVRFGPALGLMGTLIPLAPALQGLADGNVTQLTQNLRLAFSVTVLGLLIGATAFSISLVRDRMYAQDLSDLEAIAGVLTGTPDLVAVGAEQEQGELV
jgi:biopolymer transport protein ExbB/TolQ